MEADDILGSLAKQAVEKGLGVKIITGDKDLLQLVNDRVVVSLPGKSLSESRDYFEKDVMELLGVSPKQVIDYKALVGDTSDNYPGVKGVGDKTAVGLLQDFPSLDEIYANLDKIKERTRELLINGKENRIPQPGSGDHSHRYCNHARPGTCPYRPIGYHRSGSAFPRAGIPIDDPRADPFEKYNGVTEPKGSQMELFGEPVTKVGTSGSYSFEVTIQNETALTDMLSDLASSPMIAFDTETTALDPMEAKLVGLSLSGAEGKGYYIPVGHATGSSSKFRRLSLR